MRQAARVIVGPRDHALGIDASRERRCRALEKRPIVFIDPPKRVVGVDCCSCPAGRRSKSSRLNGGCTFILHAIGLRHPLIVRRSPRLTSPGENALRQEWAVPKDISCDEKNKAREYSSADL